jgi:hypothetical protein
MFAWSEYCFGPIEDDINVVLLLLTVIVKVQLSLLAEASVATHFTVVTPIAKAVPDAGVQTALTTEQLSEVDGANVTTAVVCPRSATVTMFAGQVMTGGVLSITVTGKLQYDLFPDESQAV